MLGTPAPRPSPSPRSRRASGVAPSGARLARGSLRARSTSSSSARCLEATTGPCRLGAPATPTPRAPASSTRFAGPSKPRRTALWHRRRRRRRSTSATWASRAPGRADAAALPRPRKPCCRGSHGTATRPCCSSARSNARSTRAWARSQSASSRRRRAWARRRTWRPSCRRRTAWASGCSSASPMTGQLVARTAFRGSSSPRARRASTRPRARVSSTTPSRRSSGTCFLASTSG
mmetsp:Transcript_126135/g.365071  ORF Transcript_126135/g.365071 Transcript_126135/m.365071 type:complete len:234 (+) Transcript_126135:818-1519(+)